ncbi:MAG: ABC-type sugar transport system, ATPase component [Capsulimonas sp.]|nr:ABC-type sugar transport system, ATPase component [Capsulimonas sp.]
MEAISKSFPGVKALQDVSFDVVPGEVHAIMGENGAGMSTLMKIMAGAYKADTGRILMNGKPIEARTPQQAMELGIQIIYQELNLVPHLSVAENIFLGRMTPGPFPGSVDHRKMRDQARKILADLGLDVDVSKPVNQLSIAQQQLVEIAKATSRKALVIAMDEPSATLTEHEQVSLWRLVKRLRDSGIGIIYISHRMDEVFMLADRVTVLRDGKTIKTHKMSETTPEILIGEMVGRSLESNFPKVVAPVGKSVLTVSGLNRKGVLRDINLTVNAGEVVALAGLVGSGRTEIARCIFGADPYDSGTFTLDGQPYKPKSPHHATHAGIGFVTEDRKGQGLILPMSVRENTTLASLDLVSSIGKISFKREREAASKYVTSLRTRTPSVEQRVGNLSGGNQQKVVLAKWLFRNTKLLILDEPTRGIDVGAKVEIYQLINELAAQGIGILMISSELPEVLGMADRILVINQGRVAGELNRDEATQEKVGALAVGA